MVPRHLAKTLSRWWRLAIESTVHAVVLRRRDAQESDRRLTILTEELGVIDVVAKGAKKAGSRLAGATEPLTVSEFQIAVGRRVSYVTQSQPISSFPGLRSDFDRIALGVAFAELARLVLPAGGPAPGAFSLAVQALRYLEVHPQPIIAAIWAELQLMSLVGMLPHFDICTETHETLRENPAWIAPRAGGYVHSSIRERFGDGAWANAEWLIAAARTAELDRPPERLRNEYEVFRMLHRFWTYYAENPLDARTSVIKTALAI